jgi:5-oxoprolinase (ATP-hydrolysing)
VANAPHIPVHLGAMGESVRAVLEAHPQLLPGDVFVTNDPACGGSHLPDVTVVSPVHDEHGQLRFLCASRGHHADIGGITPGSMPPDSSQLVEEGVVFTAQRVVRGGVFDRESVLERLRAGPYPARNPQENLADLEAQIAANHAGARLLGELEQRFGREVVSAYMGHIQDNAAEAVDALIARLPAGRHEFCDALDDGTPVAVSIVLAEGRMRVDFAGSGAEHPGNLNAPRAVAVAALLYVLRCLVGKPIPLNSGCLRHVELAIPSPSLLAPSPGRAVVAGNVETSQRVVDVLLGALGVAAASQGTMNNFTFGSERFGYYETLAGGAGASARAPGASAVHTHMTNTRITDPEVLERRFPVRLRRFAIRRGSGGAGYFRGGDGLVREFELLAPLRVSFLAERRQRAPFGLDGGHAGAPGHNRVNGKEVPGRSQFALDRGDVVTIETPGGGGFGRPR